MPTVRPPSDNGSYWSHRAASWLRSMRRVSLRKKSSPSTANSAREALKTPREFVIGIGLFTRSAKSRWSTPAGRVWIQLSRLAARQTRSTAAASAFVMRSASAAGACRTASSTS